MEGAIRLHLHTTSFRLGNLQIYLIHHQLRLYQHWLLLLLADFLFLLPLTMLDRNGRIRMHWSVRGLLVVIEGGLQGRGLLMLSLIEILDNLDVERDT